MTDPSGRPAPLWIDSALPAEQPLPADVKADVCVVGAGIAGLSAAYLLAREGKSVVVLDDGPIGGSESGRTTAHLSYALDDRYYQIENLHGAQGAQLAAASHKAAIDCIESIIGREAIECDFERLDGYLFIPPGGSLEELERERDATRRAGLGEVDFVGRAPLSNFDTGRCLRFPRQAQFHPRKYLNGLAHPFNATVAAFSRGRTPIRPTASLRCVSRLVAGPR